MSGKMKKVSPTHIQEEDSLTILRSSLNSKDIFIQNIGGVNPSTDGILHFLNKDSTPRTFPKDNRELVAKTDYQLKSTTIQGKKTYSFSIKDLRYYSKCSHPVFIFFVDIPNKITYWELIDLAYIADVLKISDVDATTAKSKTVHFKDEKIIGNVTSEDLFSDFSKIPSKAPSPTEIPKAAVVIEENKLTEYKGAVSQLIQGDLKKILDLEALIFFQTPFILTEVIVLNTTLSKVELTLTEFNFYTEKLVSTGIMTRVGDVLSVTDSKAAQGLLSELINEKGIEYVYG
jgi:hypothetical protein